MAIKEAPDRAGRESVAVAAEQSGKLNDGNFDFGLDCSQDHVR